MKIIRKNGREEAFCKLKIVNAVLKSARRTSLNESVRLQVAQTTADTVEATLSAQGDNVTTVDMHKHVMEALHDISPTVEAEYRAYRNYKERTNTTLHDTYDFLHELKDNGLNENANKDSDLVSTKMNLISEHTMGELYRTFELSPEMNKAHGDGVLHVHDMSHLGLDTFNCCLFDVGSLFKNSFEINGVVYDDIDSVRTALIIAGNIVIKASGNQFGGYTIPEFDKIFAPFCERTYERELNRLLDEYGDYVPLEKLQEDAAKHTKYELRKGYLAFETTVNTIENALSQTPFCTITFGTTTSYWGREIQKTILRQRIKGLGKTHTTPLFPKLVFFMLDGLNEKPSDVNYDIFQLALECNRKRIYPDFLSLDAGYTGEIWKKHGVTVSPMGCRAYLSEYNNSDIFAGRANIGAV
ncbi:MAG: anaerobic ribonucleoside-triphosphate reductase, partial [Bacilli bacterium]